MLVAELGAAPSRADLGAGQPESVATVKMRGGGEVAEGLELSAFEASRTRGVHQFAQEPPPKALTAELGIEQEEPHAGNPFALICHRKAADMPAVALDDPDRLGVAREPAQRRPRHRRRDVRLHAGVEAVLAGVDAAVVLDDRAEVAGTELAPDRGRRHGYILAADGIVATHSCHRTNREIRSISLWSYASFDTPRPLRGTGTSPAPRSSCTSPIRRTRT